MKNRFLSLAVLFLALLPACQEKETPVGSGINKSELTVDKEQIRVPAQASEDAFTISSNCYWNVSVADADGKAVTWVSLSEVSGQATKDIKVSVNANSRTEERWATIRITSPSTEDLTRTI